MIVDKRYALVRLPPPKIVRGRDANNARTDNRDVCSLLVQCAGSANGNVVRKCCTNLIVLSLSLAH